VLSGIVSFALRFRGVVVALALAVVAYGIYGLARARYDVFPEFAPPEVVVQTEATGLSPEQVEVLVTQPIENAVAGIPGLVTVRSYSIQGVSVVTLLFGSGQDIFLDRQLVAERLGELTGQLPLGVSSPVMVPLTSSTGDLMVVGLTSDRLNLMQLRTIADWTVTPRLLAVPGVAKVGTYGGEVRQLQVQLDPSALVRHGLGIEEVVAAAGRATGVRGAGWVDTLNQRVLVATEGQALAPEELGRVVVRHGASGNVTLADVASVVDGPAPAISYAAVNGTPGVVLNLWAQYHANTLEVTARLDRALADLEPGLSAQGVNLDPTLFRAATFIETATGNVKRSLLVGACLVVAVLFLLLYDLRGALISCTAIPLSLLAALTVLDSLGVTLNTMTLGGLAIAIGEVVDDAIIDVENILRRLKENRALGLPRSAFAVVFDASLEVRGAVVYASFSVMLVFLPIITLSGLAGRLFAPLGIAYVLAVMASLLVALTVTPALASLLVAHRRTERHESPIAARLKSGYVTTLAWLDARRVLPLAGAAVLTILGASLVPLLKEEFLPAFREAHFIAHVAAVPGTSLAESRRLGEQATRALLDLPGVRRVAQRAGRAAADDILGPHDSELEIDFEPIKGKALVEARERVRETLERVPGLQVAVNSFLTERIEETVSGYTAPVVVKVVGTDLDLLDRKAEEVAALLRGIAGAVDVALATPPGTPQLTVRLRPNDVARWGLAPLDVLEAVQTAYEGAVVAQVYDANRIFDLAVTLAPGARNVSTVADLPLLSAEGTFVRLGQVADVFEGSGRYAVNHEGGRRVAVVTCDVEGRAVPDFVAEARAAVLSRVDWPAGTYPELAGVAEEQRAARNDLLVKSALAALLIVLLLATVFGHARNLLLVLCNLPFALVGGILASFLTGGTLTVGAMVGFVTLFGVTLRNAIMMLTHFEHLVRVEGAAWGRETVIRGASERLLPILMTATVTGLGLLPLALGSGAPGREIEGPMAVIILAGLVTSTILNLLVLPSLALRFGRFGDVGDRPA
jgi:CzcA family heavy metal efflux pump